jgi:hypothetical protein
VSGLWLYLTLPPYIFLVVFIIAVVIILRPGEAGDATIRPAWHATKPAQNEYRRNVSMVVV